MRNVIAFLVVTCGLVPVPSAAQTFQSEMDGLVEASCIACRDADTETRLPGDYMYPSVADLQPFAGVYAAGGAKNYKGEGIAVRAEQVCNLFLPMLNGAGLETAAFGQSNGVLN